jgi:hypothetical protein
MSLPTDAELVRRAVRNARGRDVNATDIRWHAVSLAFGLGSTSSIELCEREQVNPHEQVEGVSCERCIEEYEPPEESHMLVNPSARLTRRETT